MGSESKAYKPWSLLDVANLKPVILFTASTTAPGTDRPDGSTMKPVSRELDT
jgi:hypothetical protein